MNYTDRNDIYSDDKFVGQVRMALCDWVEYWAVTGTSSIDDPELRNLTDSFIRCAVSNIETYVSRLAVLVISEPAVKEAVEVTDANVNIAVTNLLARALPYLL